MPTNMNNLSMNTKAQVPADIPAEPFPGVDEEVPRKCFQDLKTAIKGLEVLCADETTVVHSDDEQRAQEAAGGAEMKDMLSSIVFESDDCDEDGDEDEGNEAEEDDEDNDDADKNENDTDADDASTASSESLNTALSTEDAIGVGIVFSDSDDTVDTIDTNPTTASPSSSSPLSSKADGLSDAGSDAGNADQAHAPEDDDDARADAVVAATLAYVRARARLENARVAAAARMGVLRALQVQRQRERERQQWKSWGRGPGSHCGRRGRVVGFCEGVKVGKQYEWRDYWVGVSWERIGELEREEEEEEGDERRKKVEELVERFRMGL
ncbi:hypothetical protein BDY21DRAFT_368235 [Lineolata rhizophorae]|uniref:Uncharacterized protein n=1 Tax=Lineolata rhizophorae TaxID=578093 RepID=A0A6A6PDR0_9PEZI|nr:hypothetical protein BDY21DRAFT_368235 [Lineolata rhizophorae]